MGLLCLPAVRQKSFRAFQLSVASADLNTDIRLDIRGLFWEQLCVLPRNSSATDFGHLQNSAVYQLLYLLCLPLSLICGFDFCSCSAQHPQSSSLAIMIYI
jgi:hypothetical protein